MHLVRSIFLILTLLAQAWPVAVVRATEVKAKCPMSCCAEEGAAACGCAKAPDAPQMPVPANTPPASGRELVPQVTYVTSLEVYLPKPMCRIVSHSESRLWDERGECYASPRLTVLHCAFLI